MELAWHPVTADQLERAGGTVDQAVAGRIDLADRDLRDRSGRMPTNGWREIYVGPRDGSDILVLAAPWAQGGWALMTFERQQADGPWTCLFELGPFEPTP